VAATFEIDMLRLELEQINVWIRFL
jgi:hypothetical protein